MDLTHRFTVPVPIDETWAHFQDVASVAQCFPGAMVTSVEGDTFAGSVKVRLGPIALVYNGSGTFVEKDVSAHRLRVDALGKDKRGNGTASANVGLTLSDPGGSGGSTEVEVVTVLTVTGKPAQFGRDVIQGVSDKLLGQFVDCLEQRLTAESAAPEPVPEPVPSSPGTAPTAAPLAAPSEGAVPSAGDDSLNLGAAVLPVVAKTYWKQGVGALVVVLLVWWWVAGRD